MKSVVEAMKETGQLAFTGMSSILSVIFIPVESVVVVDPNFIQSSPVPLTYTLNSFRPLAAVRLTDDVAEVEVVLVTSSNDWGSSG